MAEFFVRIKPGRGTPGTYHTLGVQFVGARWYRLPGAWDFEGTEVPVSRLKGIMSEAGFPVFDVCTQSEAERITEADKRAEFERLVAEAKVTGVATMDAVVTPAVKAIEVAEATDSVDADEPTAKSDAAPAAGRRGRGSRSDG